ncbi:MAG: ATP-binding protein [Ignavibacteriales bacterium]|nr:ATP-binding protein [Ignavibacteriales bacterium]
MNKKNFTIDSEYKNVSSVCFITKTFCEENNLFDEKIKEIELSLAEALNNIIKHAYKGDETNQIEISMWFDSDKFSIELIDYGEPRLNTGKPVLEFDPDDIDSLPEGGMGLFIIEQLMDENHYSREGNKNIFRLVKNVN